MNLHKTKHVEIRRNMAKVDEVYQKLTKYGEVGRNEAKFHETWRNSTKHGDILRNMAKLEEIWRSQCTTRKQLGESLLQTLPKHVGKWRTRLSLTFNREISPL